MRFFKKSGKSFLKKRKVKKKRRNSAEKRKIDIPDYGLHQAVQHRVSLGGFIQLLLLLGCEANEVVLTEANLVLREVQAIHTEAEVNGCLVHLGWKSGQCVRESCGFPAAELHLVVVPLDLLQYALEPRWGFGKRLLYNRLEWFVIRDHLEQPPIENQPASH